ncbi:MAG: hypothetical protein ACLR4A_17005 [Christensenellales bacterium]
MRRGGRVGAGDGETAFAPVSFCAGEEEALSDISLNLSANMLGLGGAATPAGISAMKTMARANPDGRASNAMILFLVVNTSSVQLLPTTMIAPARRPERPIRRISCCPRCWRRRLQPCAAWESAVFWRGGAHERAVSAGALHRGDSGGAVGADERL